MVEGRKIQNNNLYNYVNLILYTLVFFFFKHLIQLISLSRPCLCVVVVFIISSSMLLLIRCDARAMRKSNHAIWFVCASVDLNKIVYT